MSKLPEILKYPLASTVKNFGQNLIQSGFSGDFETELGERLASATDNSIYRVVPSAIAYPRSTEDVQAIMSLACDSAYKEISFTARGGLTGTNGQSLSTGIIIDFSRYMRSVRDIHREDKWVWVEPGVVLDQLNEVLRPLDLFFAVDVSSGSRATLGGMIATDASGKCSTIHGKTLQHLLELEWVDTEGKFHRSSADPTLCCNEDHILLDSLGSIFSLFKEDIAHKYPSLPRTLTGYNLKDAYFKGHINLLALLCGSEGTLGIVTGAKLKLHTQKAFKGMAVVFYTSFHAALAHAQEILTTNPDAIETIDEQIVAMALSRGILPQISKYLQNPLSMNLIEWSSFDIAPIQNKLREAYMVFCTDASQKGISSVVCLDHAATIKAFWELRKLGVGLSAALSGNKKALPFIEDTAVPPDVLHPYFIELEQLLKSYGLEFCAFGHIDAGCLHIRPRLDLSNQEDSDLIPVITKEVVALVQKYGGLLWGEHGKGFRSVYNPVFFGTLYTCLQKIKTVFDPFNKLNPGKVAIPSASTDELVSITPIGKSIQAMGIAPAWKDYVQDALNCNGNGACHAWDNSNLMCPSYKATYKRSFSPKGRSDLFRDWANWNSAVQLRPNAAFDLNTTWFKKTLYRFGLMTQKTKSLFRNNGISKNQSIQIESEIGFENPTESLKTSLDACLSCKACTYTCPVRVDIPSMRSHFLYQYYTHHFRPLREYVFGYMEQFLLKSIGLYQWIYRLSFSPLVRFVMEKGLRISYLPQPARKEDHNRWLRLKLPIYSEEEKVHPNAVCIYVDAFHLAFAPQVLTSLVQVLKQHGYQPYRLPLFSTGKGWHLHGFLNLSKWWIEKRAAFLEPILEQKIPIICIEPSLALYMRQEVPKMLPWIQKFPRPFLLPWEFLTEWPSQKATTKIPIHIKMDVFQKSSFNTSATAPSQTPASNTNSSNPPIKTIVEKEQSEVYRLFLHCSEASTLSQAGNKWKELFVSRGLQLEVANVGCCGMAGTFGHHTEHQELSQKIFETSWRKPLLNHPLRNLATGYSCRTQTERFAQKRMQHPLEILGNI